MLTDMPQKQRCELIINGASGLAAAAAASTVIPGADSVTIAPIQVGMIGALAREFGQRPGPSLLKAALYSSLGTIVGRGGHRVLMRFIPGAGNVVRASIAFSVTQALGRLVLEQLEAGEGL